jgi:hypothetical protein
VGVGCRRANERVSNNSELPENPIDLLLEEGNILFHSEPDFINVDSEIVVDQFVVHPRNILPRDVRISPAQTYGEALGCLPDDFDLPDDPVWISVFRLNEERDTFLVYPSILEIASRMCLR